GESGGGGAEREVSPPPRPPAPVARAARGLATLAATRSWSAASTTPRRRGSRENASPARSSALSWIGWKCGRSGLGAGEEAAGALGVDGGHEQRHLAGVAHTEG